LSALLIFKIIVTSKCPTFFELKKKKVKHSHYRPGVAQRVPRKLRFPDYMTMAQDGGKVVSLMHWLPLHPGNAPGNHFC